MSESMIGPAVSREPHRPTMLRPKVDKNNLPIEEQERLARAMAEQEENARRILEATDLARAEEAKSVWRKMIERFGGKN